MMSDSKTARDVLREKYELYIELQKNKYDKKVSEIEAKYRYDVNILEITESTLKPQQYPPAWWSEEAKLYENMEKMIRVYRINMEDNTNPYYVMLDELNQQDEQDDEYNEQYEQDDKQYDEYPLKNQSIQLLLKQEHDYMDLNDKGYQEHLKKKLQKRKREQ
jgi:hypothetical protein